MSRQKLVEMVGNEKAEKWIQLVKGIMNKENKNKKEKVGST